MLPMLADWVQGIALPVLLVLLGAGGAGWYATIRAERRAGARAPQEQQSLELDITEKLQTLADRALEQMQAQMERSEEEHGRQLGALRIEMERMKVDHAARLQQLETQHDLEKRAGEIERDNLQSEIAVLKDALGAAKIPIPSFIPRTA